MKLMKSFLILKRSNELKNVTFLVLRGKKGWLLDNSKYQSIYGGIKEGGTGVKRIILGYKQYTNTFVKSFVGLICE